MSSLKGEFVWADVQLGPSQVSAFRISEVSAFQGLIYAIIYEDNSVPEQTVRKNEMSAFQGFGIAGFHCNTTNQKPSATRHATRGWELQTTDINNAYRY